MSFPDNDPVWRRFAEHAITDMLPKLTESAASISMVPKAGDAEAGDVKYWTELGASIMLDKPIVLVVHPDRTEIPAKLMIVADEVIVADPATDAGRQEISERVTLFMEGLE